MTGAVRRPALAWVTGLALASCGPPPDERGGAGMELSDFALDTPVTAEVVENVTACEVDAVCFLRLRFADTTVAALYGTGERPAPPCEMTTAVSDVAFRVREGVRVDVVVAPCGAEGLYLRRVLPAPD